MRKRITQLFAGLLFFGGTALFAASCGGAGLFGDNCSLGGKKCEFGCAQNLGCVDCQSDGDCPQAEPFCILGKCGECFDANDCAVNEACYPREHECLPVCNSNADCADVHDAHICDPDTGACVGCIDDTDCPGDKPICEPERQQCAECASNADCGAAEPACDLQSGECRECLIDTDCKDGFACDSDHHCKSVCTGDEDCTDPDRPICNVDTGSCVECGGDVDCPAGRPTCNPNGQCVECLTAAQCTDPDLGVCKDGECVQCDKDEDCPAATPKCKNQVCEP